MRLLITFCLAAGFSGMAAAHTLPDSENSVQQLAHQLLSLHHLPGLILLLVAGLYLYKKRDTVNQQREKS